MFFFAEQPRLHRVLEPQDALKAAYQAAFGAEHLGPDPGYARRLLHEELAACTSSPDKPLTEPLSDDICRIDLAAWKGRSLPEESSCPSSCAAVRPAVTERSVLKMR